MPSTTPPNSAPTERDVDAIRRLTAALRDCGDAGWATLRANLASFRGDDFAAVRRRARHGALVFSAMPSTPSWITSMVEAMATVGELAREFRPPGSSMARSRARTRTRLAGWESFHAAWTELWDVAAAHLPEDDFGVQAVLLAGLAVGRPNWSEESRRRALAPLRGVVTLPELGE